MEILKITPLKRMASGARFCALVTEAGRNSTGFGKTEDQAVANAEKNLIKPIRIGSRTDRFIDRKRKK